MALRDELQAIDNSVARYDDEEVYKELVDNFYEQNVKREILRQYTENSSAQLFSGEFFFSDTGIIIIGEEIKKYNNSSMLYNVVLDDYDNIHSVTLKNLVDMNKEKGKRKRIFITALGKRVLKDLTRIAEADGIVLSEPKPYYFYEYLDLMRKKKRKYYYPALNEDFIANESVNKGVSLQRLDIGFGAKIEYEFRLVD